MGISGQASNTEVSADAVGEALGDGLSEAVGSALLMALGDAVRELDGLADALGDVVSAGLAEGTDDSDGVGAVDVTTGVAAGDEEVDTEALGAGDAISPLRPLSAVSSALLAMALGNDDAEALSLDVALAEGAEDAEDDSESEADADGDALLISDGDADANSDALGEVVADADAVADGEALAIGSTMQGSCGALICSDVAAGVSEALAAVPVPNVAKARLAATVIATPPVRLRPRL